MICTVSKQDLQLILSIKPACVFLLYSTWCKRGGVHPLDAQPVPLWASNLISVGLLWIVIVVVNCYCELLLWIVIVYISVCITQMHIAHAQRVRLWASNLVSVSLLWIVIVIVNCYCALLLCIFQCASLRCTLHTAQRVRLWASNLVSAGALCIV